MRYTIRDIKKRKIYSSLFFPPLMAPDLSSFEPSLIKYCRFD